MTIDDKEFLEHIKQLAENYLRGPNWTWDGRWCAKSPPYLCAEYIVKEIDEVLSRLEQ